MMGFFTNYAEVLQGEARIYTGHKTDTERIRPGVSLLMSGRRPNCDSGKPDLWSNGSVFMGPREPISIDPCPHILLQQTTAMVCCSRKSPVLQWRGGKEVSL